ncbi:MAG: 50S ribosomal protein L21e [Nitrososphaeria archaeon]|nr:50S ribosomal protein L21e [Nitrososphaerota archaeon]
MPKHKGPRRKTRSLMTAEGPRGLSRLMEEYKPGDRVVIDIDPSQPKGLPHRRYQGRVGIVKEVRRRSLVIGIRVSPREEKIVVARLEHVVPLRS